MSDIVEYERRISAALSKISEKIGSNTGGGSDTSELEKALETERSVNAQLEERVRAIKSKQDDKMAQLEKRVATLQAGLGQLEGDVTRLKGVNGQLRENNDSLRAANEQGVADPHLINKSMLAELESLRAVHTSDRHEMDTLLGELSQIIGEDA